MEREERSYGKWVDVKVQRKRFAGTERDRIMFIRESTCRVALGYVVGVV